ncbi:MAG: hypothetical protein AAGA31_16045, partial [Bacteroidota bacterium]
KLRWLASWAHRVKPVKKKLTVFREKRCLSHYWTFSLMPTLSLFTAVGSREANPLRWEKYTLKYLVV